MSFIPYPSSSRLIAYCSRPLDSVLRYTPRQCIILVLSSAQVSWREKLSQLKRYAATLTENAVTEHQAGLG